MGFAPHSIIAMQAHALPLLAQSDVTSLVSVMLWSAATLVLIILCFLGYTQLKRWMQQPDEPEAAGFGFSDLRELHRQGKLTDQEYETARQKMLGSAKQMTGNLPDPLAGSRKSPGQSQANPPVDRPDSPL